MLQKPQKFEGEPKRLEIPEKRGYKSHEGDLAKHTNKNPFEENVIWRSRATGAFNIQRTILAAEERDYAFIVGSPQFNRRLGMRESSEYAS